MRRRIVFCFGVAVCALLCDKGVTQEDEMISNGGANPSSGCRMTMGAEQRWQEITAAVRLADCVGS